VLNAKSIITKLVLTGSTLFTLTFQCSLAVAGNVTFTPFFGLKEIYSDNARQQKKGGQDELITQIIPGFDLHGASHRAKYDIRYELQSTYFSKSDRDGDSVSHKLNADTTINLVRNELLLNASVQRSQANIQNNTSLPIVETYNISDPTNVTTSTVNPSYQKHFGVDGKLFLSYTNTNIRFDGNEVEQRSLSTQDYNATLSDRLNDNIKWELGYDKIDNPDDPDALGLQKTYLMLNFRVGNRVSFFYQAGDEEEFYWLAGANWVPNKRNSLSANYGHRFFGDTKGLSLKHRSKNTGVEVTYTEEVESVPIISSFDLAVDSKGVPIRDEKTGGFFVRPTIISGALVEKKLQAVFSLTGKRLGLAVAFVRQELDNVQKNLSAKTRSAVLRLGWKSTKNLEVVYESKVRKDFFADNVREDELASNKLALNHSIGRKVTLSYELRHSELDSNEVDVGYKENAISVLFNMRF